MATTRIKDISKTTTDLASDTYGVFDGATNGTQKMARNDMYADWAAAYVAAPTTYKLAPLNSGTNKIDATYLPTSGDTPKGEWNASTNSPSLADGSGTAGDYYDVTTAGTQDLGSGSIAYTVGDVVKYNGSTWYKIDSVANILDGSATAADGRSALSVNSIDEDAEATGTKLVGPALYFNGSSSFMEIAYSSKTSFTDGSSDTPFAFSGWCKKASGDQVYLISKRDDVLREYLFQISATGAIYLELFDSSNNTAYAYTAAGVVEDDKWTHVAATFSANSAASSAADDIVIYKNGVAQSVTAYNAGGYTGMTDNSKPLWIQKASSSSFGAGHIRNVQIFNRELTADEVAQLARGNDLGFSSEWGDHTTEKLTDGGMETWASGTDLTNWAEGSAVSVAQEAVDIQAGTYSCELTGGGAIGSSGNNWLSQNCGITSGKRYRFTGKVKRFSGSTDSLEIGVRYWPFVRFDGTTFTVNTNATYMPESRIVNQASLGGGWYSVTVEFVTFAGGLNELVFGVTGATDPYLIDDCSLVQIGTLADFRSENFIADKLIDQSSNNFVGTNNGATLVGGRKALQLDTDGAAAGNNVLSIYNGSSHLAYLTDKGDLNANSISSGASTELTIATGAVTATKSYHTIDTESDAASDDLDTISGGRAGQILVVQANNSARSVVLKDGTGNLKLSGDITLDNAEDTATLVSDGTSWYLIATSNNGA